MNKVSGLLIVIIYHGVRGLVPLEHWNRGLNPLGVWIYANVFLCCVWVVVALRCADPPSKKFCQMSQNDSYFQKSESE
jgi:hypothetical protein